MAILDVFKKEDAEAKKAHSKTEGGRAKKAKAAAPAKASTETKKVSADSGTPLHTATGIIKRPHITEKAAMVAEKNVYTFEVADNANKTEVAKAVKAIYNVDPIKVNIVRLPSKTVFRRGKLGTVSGKKKATVYLKEGQSIEFV